VDPAPVRLSAHTSKKVIALAKDAADKMRRATTQTPTTPAITIAAAAAATTTSAAPAPAAGSVLVPASWQPAEQQELLCPWLDKSVQHEVGDVRKWWWWW
jgi:hypothetical protein